MGFWRVLVLKKLPVTLSSCENVTVYVVYKNNAFQGVAVNIEAKLLLPNLSELLSEGEDAEEPEMTELTLKLSVGLGVYDGTLKMPTFGNDYIAVSPEDIF